VELSSHGAANRKQTMEVIYSAIAAVPTLSANDIIFGGYPFIATTIDRLLLNSLRFFLIPSIVIATIISFLCLRDLALMGIVFTTSISAATISLTIIPLVGVKFGGLMSIIPALVFVLTTSGCIHLIRYSLSSGTSPRALLSIGGLPCTVSALTTVVGMLALTGSQFPAIRKFGLFCAVGVTIGWIFQLVILPWLLQRFGKSSIERLAERQSKSIFWHRWCQHVANHKIGLCLICLLLLVSGVLGMRYLRAEVQVKNLFRTDSPVLVSQRKLEEHLGPLNQTELVVIFHNVDEEKFDERVNQIKSLQSAVAQIEGVHFTYSLVNYLPDEPTVTDGQSLAMRSMYRSRLRNERQNLGNRRNLIVDEDQEIWRISVRFPFTQNNDWDALRRNIEEVTVKILREFTRPDPSRRIDYLQTGRANLFQHAQTNLLHDLFRNFLLAFAVITPILIIALRSLAIGLLAMLPNLFPAVLLFGGLGFIGYPVDLAIAMTACIALGIAVDDTTHFLVRFRDLGGKLSNAKWPIEQAIVQCGPAMAHTTLIACGGLLIYSFGEMLVVARFSIMISLLLCFAIIADLIMMPSILLSLEAFAKMRNSSKQHSG
jgi:predicted RND superfamily exporter protein